MNNTKVNENRLRRVADRQGLQLRKSRRRDPNAVDYGLYALIERSYGSAIHPHGVISEYDLTLEDVGLYLEGFDCGACGRAGKVKAARLGDRFEPCNCSF